MSHLSCVVYAVVMAGFLTGLFYAGVGMGYLYLMMGVIIGSAVLPATLALMWKDQNWIAAAATPVLGLACALIAWLVTAKKECDSINVDCTGAKYVLVIFLFKRKQPTNFPYSNPMLAGNVVALLSPLIFIPVLTFAFGKQNYDWLSMKDIQKADDSDLAAAAHMDLELTPGAMSRSQEAEAAEQAKLKKAGLIAGSLTVFMTLAFLVVWPM